MPWHFLNEYKLHLICQRRQDCLHLLYLAIWSTILHARGGRCYSNCRLGLQRTELEKEANTLNFGYVQVRIGMNYVVLDREKP